MNESTLKSELVKRAKAAMVGAVVLRHEDRLTAGIPDISITWRGKTTWWEVKYAHPRCDSTGIQELTLQRLAASGYARYITYYDVGGIKSVFVNHPNGFTRDPSTNEVTALHRATGFDHNAVVRWIMEAHG